MLIGRTKVRPVAAQRLERSLAYTDDLTKLTEKDVNIKEKYYEKKLNLYEKKLNLYEREVIAKEKIANAVEKCGCISQ